MPREFDSDTFKIHLDKSISIETYKKKADRREVINL